MADLIYANFKRGLGLGLFDLPADTLKCALLTSGYTPNASHAIWADVVAYEAAGLGYVAGGATLGSVDWNLVGEAVALAAADPVWTEVSITARYAVIYVAKKVEDLVNPLVCLLDFSAEKGVMGGTFRVAFDAAGIVAFN